MEHLEESENKIEKKIFTRESYERMDEVHKPVNDFAFKNIKINDFDNYLDIGCGSGQNIKRFLETAKNGYAVGIDISDAAIELSTKLNSSEINDERCKIIKEKIESFDYEKDYFNLVGAFCTVKFWDNLKKDFETVYKVTKKDGSFIICDHGHYDIEEVVDTLIKVGFKKVVMETKEPDLSCIIAIK